MRSKIPQRSSSYHYIAVVAMVTALLPFAIIANTPAMANSKTVIQAGTTAPPHPAPQLESCKGTDTQCLLPVLESFTAEIDDIRWRDQIFRETAKLYAARNNMTAALAILPRIETPDTRALTIRGIGMEAARLDLPEAEKQAFFTTLRAEADKIDHAPSHAIALTYIAMAQAFAGDDEGAHRTASAMDNAALRDKAFGETAEIQAERGDITAAMHSLSAIDDPVFLDKSNDVIARILADRGNYDAAIAIAGKTGNPYLKSRSLLYILAKQITPHDTGLGIRE